MTRGRAAAGPRGGLSVLRAALVLSCAAAGAAAPARGQGGHEEDAVLAAVRVMFDGLTEQDTAKMASVIDPEARLVQTFTRDGAPVMRSIPMDEFLGSIARHTGGRMVERYWDPAVRVHDNLATVWISYAFYVAGEMTHCGEDTFQLAKTPAGWTIIALADTQRREGCREAG